MSKSGKGQSWKTGEKTMGIKDSEELARRLVSLTMARWIKSHFGFAISYLTLWNSSTFLLFSPLCFAGDGTGAYLRQNEAESEYWTVAVPLTWVFTTQWRTRSRGLCALCFVLLAGTGFNDFTSWRQQGECIVYWTDEYSHSTFQQGDLGLNNFPLLASFPIFQTEDNQAS